MSLKSVDQGSDILDFKKSPGCGIENRLGSKKTK